MYTITIHGTKNITYFKLQPTTYNQIQQQQKNIEQPRNISQTLNRETTVASTIVVVDPRKTYKSYARQEFNKISVTRIIIL